VAAFEQRGAEVRIHGEAGNFVRARRAGEGPGPSFVVEVQGAANLFHELVHAVRVGAVLDDHGIDYARMPFSLGDPRDRALLFDELAACVLSCAYARRWWDEAWAEAWFEEQIETQPLFFGMEVDPGGFARAVDVLVGAGAPHEARVAAVVGAATDGVAAWLSAAGAAPELARPAVEACFGARWGRYLAGLRARETPGTVPRSNGSRP
jgi:hypothetical protein